MITIDQTPPVAEILQRIYRVDLDAETWLADLRRLIWPHEIETGGALLYTLRDGLPQIQATSLSEPGAAYLRSVSQIGADGGRKLPTAPPLPSTFLFTDWMDRPELAEFRDAPSLGGWADTWSFGGHSVCGAGVAVTHLLRERGHITPRAKRYWTAIATHLTASVRLRLALHAPNEAVLAPDGTLVHAEGLAKDAENRDALRRATQAIQRARRDVDDAVIALESWSALVEGRWSLVDEFENNGRHYLIARVNAPETPTLEGLSLREQQVVALAQSGRPTKQIAYELGIAAPTVATYLRRAQQKLGLGSRVELLGPSGNVSDDD